MRFRLGGNVSIMQSPLSMQNDWKFTQRNFFGSRLQDVVDNISLAVKNKCYAISFTRMEAVLALFSRRDSHTSRGEGQMQELNL